MLGYYLNLGYVIYIFYYERIYTQYYVVMEYKFKNLMSINYS